MGPLNGTYLLYTTEYTGKVYTRTSGYMSPTYSIVEQALRIAYHRTIKCMISLCFLSTINEYWLWRDLNLRPWAYESPALPLSYRAGIYVCLNI